MNVKNYFATLLILFKPSMTMNASSHDEFAETQPLNSIDTDIISIPSDFMTNIDKSIMSELLALASNSISDKNEQTVAELASSSKNTYAKRLINSIIICVDRNLSVKNLEEFCLAKSIMDKIIDKLSETSSIIISRSLLNASDRDLNNTFIIMLKNLIRSLESRDFNKLKLVTKKQRFVILRDLLLEFDKYFCGFFKSMNEYNEVKDIEAKIKEYSLKAARMTNNSNPTKKISEKKANASKNINSPNLPGSSENHTFSLMPSKHVFTCNIQPKKDNWMVKSFCKSKAGIWYFAISSGGSQNFGILKIQQNNFVITDPPHEIIEQYWTDSDKKLKEKAFCGYCRKISVDSEGNLYILKHNVSYTSSEILVLDSNFHLIKKLKSFSSVDKRMSNSFIEDFEIYNDSLYMLDSAKECIVVTDFALNVKHTIKITGVDFEKFNVLTEKKMKIRVSLIVTDESFYICFNGKMYTCKNNLKSMGKSEVQIVEKFSKISILIRDCFNSLESFVYAGNGSFISLPSYYEKFLIILKPVSDTSPLTYKSEIRSIDSATIETRTSYEMAVMEEFTVYLVEGGSCIRLFKLDYKSSN